MLKITNEGNSYQINYSFAKQSAVVSMDIEEDGSLYLTSETDGYHWFEFWLCQEPNCKKLIYEERCDNKKAEEKVRALFESFEYTFIAEDKETFFLKKESEPFNIADIELIANIIYPRFALREQFFE